MLAYHGRLVDLKRVMLKTRFDTYASCYPRDHAYARMNLEMICRMAASNGQHEVLRWILCDFLVFMAHVGCDCVLCKLRPEETVRKERYFDAFGTGERMDLFRAKLIK